MPLPSIQRCFSASATQEKGEVMAVAGSFRSREERTEAEGGMQVARVKVSTSLRMKKRGKVPPRLETLWMTLESDWVDVDNG